MENIMQKNDLMQFTSSCNQLIESKFILSEKRIASLLKTVVTLPQLVDAISIANETFDYNNEFIRARMVIANTDGTKKVKLVAPQDRVKLFAFVFCLLAEVDSGKRNLQKFLKEYFDNVDVNISFEKFCEAFVLPFKHAGELLLRDIDPESLDTEPQKVAEKYFYSERVYISTEVLNSLLTQTDIILNRLSEEKLGGLSENLESQEITQALKNAILLKNTKMIRVIFIGFKHTVSQYKQFETNIKKIEKYLIENNII